MQSLDLAVLQTALSWSQAGQEVTLCTVVKTWGSSPRPPGSIMAVSGKGRVCGSVSGGCIEDDLVARLRHGEAIRPDKPSRVVYGGSPEATRQYNLPCGGTLEIILEAFPAGGWPEELLQKVERREVWRRVLDLETGTVTLVLGSMDDNVHVQDGRLITVFGPRYRLLLIGAGELSRATAQIAQMLDYAVTVCDPREEYADVWDLPDTLLTRTMPDDTVLDMNLDGRSAVVALTHDPKLDDMALLEALKSPAFYIGALGSRASQKRRRERLAMFDLSSAEIDRLRGPVGLAIGSRTPAEIALSVMAEITAVKRQARLAKPTWDTGSEAIAHSRACSARTLRH